MSAAAAAASAAAASAAATINIQSLNSNNNNQDPDHDKLAYTCFELLLIELVPLAQRIVDDLHAKEALLLAHQGGDQHLSTDSSTVDAAVAADAGGAVTSPTNNKNKDESGIPESGNGQGEGEKQESTTGAEDETTTTTTITTTLQQQTLTSPTASFPSTPLPLPDRSSHPITAPDLSPNNTNNNTNNNINNNREQIHHLLSTLGHRVGQSLTEKFSQSLSSRPNTPLDMIKFLCKDLWILLFRKQIDNLKTNHRGTFVLTDARFPPLSRVSVDRGRGAGKGLEEALNKSQAFLWFPCGIIRGALEGFGLDVTVQAETADLKSAVFQIRTVGSKA